MKTRYATAILADLALHGCANLDTEPPIVIDSAGSGLSVSPVSGKPVDRVKTTVDVDPRLLLPCSELPTMVAENPTPEDVLAQKVIEVQLYAGCRARHSKLAELVRRAFNIN